MPIRDCTAIAIEGTQAAGKTTLVHALTAHYRERSVNVTCTGEPARTSPFMEAVVLHGQGTFDLAAELDLFALQLTTPLRAARNHRLLITDKTPANVLALAHLVLDPSEPGVAATLSAMEALCAAWMPTAYDLVVHCRDRFDQRAGGDRFRDKVLTLQDQTDHAVLDACTATGVPLVELPTGLDTPARVQWIAEQLTLRELTPH
ncbi:AAA family ATPase [Streptomyces profundus]|uniref:AAA family ATPase n=1 Tax=Streptomyces profundus TaxID=2867410 RepID=UPI001D16AF7A|nr:AAA family ATPase [Streptomyces sp. MA3_2.13]UED85047.1 AAA family ATPase [Streptomyces sp. MA3_2.13]